MHRKSSQQPNKHGNIVQRYKELVEMGKTSSARVTKARNIWKNCNGIITEANETEDKFTNEYTQKTDAQFTDNILLEIQNDSKCTADGETCLNGDRVHDVPESPRSEEVSCDSHICDCLLYTSPSPRDATLSRMPSSA